MVAPVQVSEGLWRWAAPHPEWRAGEFGREVASWAARVGDETLLIDPLEADLDLIVFGPASIVITIPYHARCAEAIAERYDATIYGHPATTKRLGDASRFTAMDPSIELPGHARCFAIGKPKRYEQPVYVPSLRALAFGDAVVTTPDGELRVWIQQADVSEDWYREHFLPTLEPLLELDVERILVTHGEPVLSGGRDALREALRAGPWYHHG